MTEYVEELLISCQKILKNNTLKQDHKFFEVWRKHKPHSLPGMCFKSRQIKVPGNIGDYYLTSD